MGKGPCLTEAETASILAYRDCGLSMNEIADKIGRSRRVVQNFLKDPENYGCNYSKSGNPKLTERDERHIIREASESGASSSTIQRELDLPVSPRQVRRVLAASEHLNWEKMTKVPKLEDRHISKRIDYATKAMESGPRWKNVIFSDEKKFNLDGPDGFQYYWRDLRTEPRTIFSRHSGGGSVQVWAAICYHGKSEIAFLSGRQTSETYGRTLQEYLLPFADKFYGSDFIFMQDNASIHCSNLMKQWFEAHNVELLDHPANSPDLNPIENCWAQLTRLVYANGKQYHSVEELKTAIAENWKRIDVPSLQKLIDSMPLRLRDVLLNRGA